MAVLLSATGALAQTQDNFTPRLLVNNSSITQYDIDQRIALLLSLGAPELDVSEVARQQIIEDELKLQLGARLGILVSEQDVAEGIAEFAAQRNLSAEELRSRNAEFGADQGTIEALIRAGLVWRQIVQGRFRSQALPTEIQLNNAINLAASAPRESVRLAEIVLPFSERGQNETLAFANDLAVQLRNGLDFSATALALSRSKSSAKGGVLDWLPADRLPPLISAQVLALASGDVTSPIAFPGGVVLLKLIGQREEPADLRPDVSVTYGDFQLTGNFDTLLKRSDSLKTCADAVRLAASFGLSDSIVGPIPLTELPPDAALRIARIDASEADIIQTEDGASILFLCERSAATDPEMRDQMRARLFSQRIAALGDGLLLELRRDAFIEEK